MPEPLLAALGAQGVSVPFPIQGATLPHTLAGRDVLGRGRTGSGKTLAFGLALLARTAGQRAEPRQPLALILVPTRELAQQVTDALTPYARAVRLRLTTVVGGMPIGRQANALRGGSEVVFMPQVTALLDQVRPEGQRMLFSATLDRNVDLLVRRYLTDPVVHSVDPPTGHKDYLHRGGRTARAGESGSVVTLVTPNQRRDMTRLMTAARIVPRTTQVRPGEAALGRITGAQEPSGIPVTITAPTAGRGRRSSPARGRRSPASAIRRTAAVRQSSFDATAA
jgi:superfamily II DNA/RNA helicase